MQAIVCLRKSSEVRTKLNELTNGAAVSMEQVVAQHQAPQAALQAAQAQPQQLQTRMAEASGNRGDAPTQVSKDWAPQPWSGQHAYWQEWSIKLRGNMEVSDGGNTGQRMQHVDSKRDASALVGTLGEESRASASELHKALVALCEGCALVIVERVRAGGGLEAWLLLKSTSQDPTCPR